MLPRVFLVVVAVATFGVLAMPAFAAKGGNSENAKQCQKGGWENVVRADGTPFESQGDCMSYSAQGGVVTDPYYAPRDLCEDAGHTFSDVGGLSGTGVPWYFRCYSGTNLSFAVNYQSSPEVQAACTAYEDGSRLTAFIGDSGDIDGIECAGPFHGT